MSIDRFNEKVDFIWSVANLLRGPYKPALLSYEPDIFEMRHQRHQTYKLKLFIRISVRFSNISIEGLSSSIPL